MRINNERITRSDSMDNQTVAAYDEAGGAFARDWSAQPPPYDLYEILRHYFKSGPTVDIGCGSGRDAAWLAAHGFEVAGYDASPGILREAIALHPQLNFGIATLPQLEGLQSGSYQNVLCETVIMHLHTDTIGHAVRSLLRLLRPSGTLYLSWRVTEGGSLRDQNGRLYSAFGKELVLNELDLGVRVLLDQEQVSLSSGKKLHRLVLRKGGPDA